MLISIIWKSIPLTKLLNVYYAKVVTRPKTGFIY